MTVEMITNLSKPLRHVTILLTWEIFYNHPLHQLWAQANPQTSKVESATVSLKELLDHDLNDTKTLRECNCLFYHSFACSEFFWIHKEQGKAFIARGNCESIAVQTSLQTYADLC